MREQRLEGAWQVLRNKGISSVAASILIVLKGCAGQVTSEKGPEPNESPTTVVSQPQSDSGSDEEPQSDSGSDEDELRSLLAQWVAAMNAADSATVLALIVVCDSTPAGASNMYDAMFSRESLLDLRRTNGEYTATLQRAAIDGDQGRVWVSASYLGSGIDASGGWGGENGTPIIREGGNWRFCRG